MLLTYSKYRFGLIALCLVMLAACKSAPPEDDEPVKPRKVSSSSSSSVKSSTSVSSSSSSSSSASSVASSSSASSSKSAGKSSAKTAPVANEPAVPLAPAPVVIPPEAQSKFSKAMLQVYAGKTDDAAAQLEQIGATYPTLSVPFINEGLMYLKANQFEAAERALKKAVERDANSAIANNYLGVAQRNLGKFKDAEVSYEAALAADDNYALAHLNIAVLYDLYLQQPDQALQHYDRYLQLVPTPDTKIAGWIKEVHTRMGVGKKPAVVPAEATAPAADTGTKP